jgi:hypothetical protein
MMQRSRVVNTLSIPVLVAVILAGNIYGAALVLIWVAASRTPWSEIGFTRWPRWWREALLALIGGSCSVYARLKRIWPIMIAHAAFDVTAAFMIYLNREEWFAHLLWH